MDSHLIRVFSGQIWLQCKFALQAYEELEERILHDKSQRDQDGALIKELGDRLTRGEITHDELITQSIEISLQAAVLIWHPIQSLLTATANISKALWGPGGKLKVEREPLRMRLGVADSSPLAATTMRNNFDHFDDRLDTWWKSSVQHNYIDLNLGDGFSSTSGIPPEEVFRNYDPQTGNLEFWGQKYHLPTIIEEVRRLMPAALEAMH